ncbi:MAG TPA: EAL domain-containing protein [Burkholderiaceae bacterium]|nr:EAL domain-containing protein [Burkholderiaceae bacterium]
MRAYTIFRRLANKASRPALSRRTLLSCLLWLAVCAALGALPWIAVESMIANEQRAFDKAISTDAMSIAGGYAQYLTRSIEQMDQVTMHIKFDWEKSHGMLRLDDLVARGLFTAPQFVLVSIADRTGRIVTTTAHPEQSGSIAGHLYFQLHKNNISSALHIAPPEVDNLSGKTVIRFTRRLDANDDKFDGVVVLSVEPEYFSAFYDGPSVGNIDFLAAVGADGIPRSSRIGARSYTPTMPALRRIPAFGRQGAAGTFALNGGRWLDAEWFTDNERRFVGWQTLTAYPLTVMVGLSERERLLRYAQSWITYRRLAAWSSAMLVMSVLVAAFMAGRLARKKQQARSVQAAYRLATESGDEGFYMLHPLAAEDGLIMDFEIMDCNARGAALFDMTKAEFLGRRLSWNYSADDFSRTLVAYRRAMASGRYEEEVQYSSGSRSRMKWARRKIVRSGDALAVTLCDITEAKAQERELIRLANTDELTGLPNRAWLMKFLSTALEQAAQTDGALALLFIDLDRFKEVNDAFGHSAGDALLREAAQRLQSTLRPADHIARFGGDEFTVVLHPAGGESEAVRVAERIIQALGQPFQLAGGIDQIGASVGISLYPRDGDTAEALLKNADIAMYAAKAEGKGACCIYRQELYESIKARVGIERALAEALEVDQFILHYQPRIDAATGKLLSLEALVRWHHPQRGIVPPMEFIPLAESTGLIVRLGALVVEKTCRQLAQWRAQGLPLAPVSINVSAVQFHHGGIYDVLAACMERFRIGPEWIELEITESAMLGDHAGIAGKLAAIQALGIKLAVDDFGTGYSSLSQLQRLDMDVLKVDRIFTAELGKKAESIVLFKAIVSMAHALGMRVVAEGVETQQQAHLLRALGCDELQGYLISRPVPPGAVPALMHGALLVFDAGSRYAILPGSEIETGYALAE